MIVVEGIHRTFASRQGAIEAVKPFDLTIRTGSLFTLLGPSGCGKTTLLRMLSGLERPDGGRIAIDDRVVFSSQERVDVPADRRGIGMVFQSYAVWPHMSVYDNVAYPLRVLRVGRATIRERVERALASVGLEGMGDRPSTQLSGGQQQRVSLARALVPEPSLLLLDEPFSNLDAHLRAQMGDELKELQQRIGVTTVYVTHDQQEALALSDELAIMNEGEIVQTGPSMELYRRPRTRFAAACLGRTNLLTGRSDRPLGPGLATLKSGVGELQVRVAESPEPHRRTFVVAIRPEDLVVSPAADDQTSAEGADCHNVIHGCAERVVFRGEALDVAVRVDAQVIWVRGSPWSPIGQGDRVRLQVDPERCTVLLDELGPEEHAFDDGASADLAAPSHILGSGRPA